MLIKDIQVGHLQTNCYIVTDEESLECAVIDPGDESNTIMDYLEDNKLVCKAIFLTHGHYDHITASKAVAKETGAPVYINPSEAEAGVVIDSSVLPPAEEINHYMDGDKIKVGKLVFTVIETPGHTPGGVCLVCGDAIFSGDTLFKDSCGRADMPGGDMGELLKSLKKLCDIEGEYEVYPGHMESTNLNRERRFNYYMKYAMENVE